MTIRIKVSVFVIVGKDKIRNIILIPRKLDTNGGRGYKLKRQRDPYIFKMKESGIIPLL